MGLPSAGSGFTGRYHHDDKRQRDEFDRGLARYLESHQERWDITALVEPLDLLGSKVGQADVRLRRLPAGTLSVTISFELSPCRDVRFRMSRPAARKHS